MKNKNILVIGFIILGLFFTSTVFADTSINLQIKTNDTTIYEGDINVAPCDSDDDPSTPDTITAYCALTQLENSVALPTKSEWSGLWINSINGVANTSSIFWMWLVNLNIETNPDFTCHQETPAGCSAKQYILNSNDDVLFYYNTNPLKISVDKQNPKVGETFKITVKELGSWGSAWNNAAFGKVIINFDPYDLDADGAYSYEIKNNESLSIKAQKTNFLDSKELSIKPEEVRRSSGSSGSYVANFVKPIIVEKVFSIEEAFSFLSKNQKEDGSFGEVLYTDWAAIAFAAGDSKEIKEKLIKYYKENNLESNLVTDNERRAMALMSLGIDPYTGTKINYIKKIIDSFDGEQFGDKNLYNDDIFALIVLKNAGYNEKDEIIYKDIKYLVSKQEEDGSWGSIDMTAAYIESMKGFDNVTGVIDSVLKSKNYIISSQKSDGGFENSSSTSWVLQSMHDNEKILKMEKYLASKQEIDGGVGKIETDMNTRIWMTSYALPAILHKSWGKILNKFNKETSKPEVTHSSPRSDLGKSSTSLEKINKNNLDILQQDIVKKVSSTSKLGTFWGNTKQAFIRLLDKLSF